MVYLKLCVASLMVLLVAFPLIEVHAALRDGEIDLSRAVVVVPDGLSTTESKAVHVLVDEVRKARESDGTPRFAGRPEMCPSLSLARPDCWNRSRKSIGNSCRRSLPARNKMDSGSRP